MSSKETKQLNNRQQNLLATQKRLDEKHFALIQKYVDNQNKLTKTEDIQNILTIFYKIKRKIILFLKNIKKYLSSKIKRKSTEYQDILLNSQLVKQNINIQELYKQQITNLYQLKLSTFLASDSHLRFTEYQNPLVSIILVLYNRAELTYECLISILNNVNIPSEIIIIDNNSTDKTNQLLDKLEGVKIINNSKNVNFLLAVNQASKIAQGEYLLLLNNDAQILPNSLNSALTTISNSDNIGAVGAKIILLDGTLQEAGSIIWQDGSCLGYGRGDNPLAPMYMFQRDVDYCSGAFLLTSRKLFQDNGGFDEDYKPAYYEETDYCLKLWQQGKRIVYDPNAVILHFEFASSQSNQNAISLQQKHQRILVKKHKNQLKTHLLPNINKVLLARSHPKDSQKVLFIDDRIPHAYLGSGFPRCRDILLSLIASNCLVTFYPLTFPEEEWKTVYQDIPRTVEIMVNYGIEKLEQFLQKRQEFYDTIIVSRPHNMSILRPILENHSEWFKKTKIIYDAEAVYALREVKQMCLKGKKVSQTEIEVLVEEELKIAKGVNSIIAVSEAERKHFLEYGFNSVYTLGHTVQYSPTSNSFENRNNLLFVGAIHEENSPNADSVFWFVENIFPKIKEQLNRPIKFIIAGFNTCDRIFQLQSDSIEVVGKVDDLTQLYNQSRLFVAPTRYAAGIPFKVHHAASYGIPMVTTSLIANQVGWEHETDLLVADDPELFAQQCVRLYSDPQLWKKLRNNSLDKINTECSEKMFTAKMKEILNT